jgi:selenocysteine-specific elongation factor
MGAPEPERHFVIGTAGHVDHGKTTLTRALTGVDTDRLKEEKEREMSIELGFAPLVLPSGRTAAIIDVPGHERFVKNMVAGVTGIDAVVLVVAADEGVMPQTREHLDILTLLEVRNGVVALTKSDLVDPDWMELTRDSVASALKGTIFDGVPLIPCSATTGNGCDALLAALDRLLEDLPGRDASGPLYMPVDRAFVMKGFGTVVTGTVGRGTVSEGDEVDILPASRLTRARGVEVHGRRPGSGHAGQRVAVNLGGIAVDEVAKGDVLCRPGSLTATSMLDVELRVLPDAEHPLSHWQRVRVHVGTAEIIARVALLGETSEIAPGATGFVQLRLESPTAAPPGTRCVVRSYSPAHTIAGGRIVDPTPGKHRGRERRAVAGELRVRASESPAGLVRRALLAQDRPAPLAEIARRIGVPVGADVAAVVVELTAGGLVVDLPGGALVSRAAFDDARRRATECVDSYHSAHPLREGMGRAAIRAAIPDLDAVLARAALADLVAEGALVAVGTELVRSHAHTPALDSQSERLHRQLLDAAKAASLAGLSDEDAARAAGGDAEIVRFAAARGDLARVGANWVLRTSLFAARDAVVAHFARAETLKVSELRDILGSSRRAIVPLLEHFDAVGLTVRRGDDRVLGRKDAAP